MPEQKKSANAINATTIALVDVKEGPKGGWIECLPSTPATRTSEMTNKMTAWLRAPTRDRSVKARTFRRSEPRSSVRMTESTETLGTFLVLDAGVLEKGFFTGPVSAAAAPVEASRSEIVVCNWPLHSVAVPALRAAVRPPSA